MDIFSTSCPSFLLLSIKAFKSSTSFGTIKDFATAIASGDATVKDMPEMKRVFRLHPPRGPKGWGGLKRSYVIGGALGPRGEDISPLVERMI